MNKIVKTLFWSNWWVAFLFQHWFIFFWATREFIYIRRKGDRQIPFMHVFRVHVETVFEKLGMYKEYKEKLRLENIE